MAIITDPSGTGFAGRLHGFFSDRFVTRDRCRP